ncbi:MAG: porin family protein [Fulvivirga sp.]|nr:porin family protein [Fulvivirga sp.]
MKRIFTVILFFVCFNITNAQVSLGLKGGLNFADVDIEELNPDSKTGYHLGGFIEIDLGGVAIQPEFLFSAKGADNIDLSYIEVPVLLKLELLKVLNFHVGPQFGFLTNAEFSGTDIKDNFSEAEISAVIGGGFNLPMGLIGGLRYVYGLTDVNDEVDFASAIISPNTSEKVKSQTLQVFIGWKFVKNRRK